MVVRRRWSRGLNHPRRSALVALAILALAPPARADFGVAARDSLSIRALSIPSLSAFT